MLKFIIGFLLSVSFLCGQGLSASNFFIAKIDTLGNIEKEIEVKFVEYSNDNPKPSGEIRFEPVVTDYSFEITKSGKFYFSVLSIGDGDRYYSTSNSEEGEIMRSKMLWLESGSYEFTIDRLQISEEKCILAIGNEKGFVEKFSLFARMDLLKQKY